MFLKKAVAQTSNKMVIFFLINLWNDTTGLKFYYVSKNIEAQSMLKIEAVFEWCSVKIVFLEISQNSQENTCATVSFLIKLQALSLQLY